MNILIVKKTLGAFLFLLFSCMMCHAQNSLTLYADEEENHLAESGVSQELAVVRAKELSDVSYCLQFLVPDDKKVLVAGKAVVSFDYHPLPSSDSLYLDFQGRQLAPYCLVNGKNHYLIEDKEINHHVGTIGIGMMSTWRFLAVG